MRKELFQTELLKFTISGELNGWTVHFREEKLAERLFILHVAFDSDSPRIPTETELFFEYPTRDVQVRWTVNYGTIHHLLPPWWNGGRIRTTLNMNAPVYSFMNGDGMNRLTYAVSEASEDVYTTTGPKENSCIITRLFFFKGLQTPVRRKAFSVRIDMRELHFSEILREVGDWYAEDPAYSPPADVPEFARFPFYSTWYQFQRNVFAEKLDAELGEAVKCNLKNVILDDGWNYDGETVGATFRHAGDWGAAPRKFPDMKSHIKLAHDRGFHYMVWFPLPFLGDFAENDFARFKDKFIDPIKDGYGRLDPRFPEVREYLTDLYEHFVKEWDLDGLKLDFIDCFITWNDRAVTENFAGRDIKSMPEAVETLLAEILARLKAIKPDILIEFRQKYVGPAMRKYGNIFRAADCAFDLLENRVRTIDLRLLSGNTAVHSDMLIWSPHDSAEVAALQILNIIFSTPQISCMLTELPEDHKRMLKFWMQFCMDHCKTLQESPIRPEHPELSYPQVSAESAEEIITAVYSPEQTICITPGKKQIVLNATHAEELVFKIKKACFIQTFNVFGEKNGCLELQAGLNSVPVSPSGFVQTTEYSEGEKE